MIIPRAFISEGQTSTSSEMIVKWEYNNSISFERGYLFLLIYFMREGERREGKRR